MNDSDANVTCGPSGSRRLPVRIGVSHTSGSGDHLRRSSCRFGMTYMSDGVDARPRAGFARRMPGQLRDQHGVGSL